MQQTNHNSNKYLLRLIIFFLIMSIGIGFNGFNYETVYAEGYDGTIVFGEEMDFSGYSYDGYWTKYYKLVVPREGTISIMVDNRDSRDNFHVEVNNTEDSTTVIYKMCNELSKATYTADVSAGTYVVELHSYSPGAKVITTFSCDTHKWVVKERTPAVVNGYDNSKAGSKTLKCSVCGKTKKKTIPAFGNVWFSIDRSDYLGWRNELINEYKWTGKTKSPTFGLIDTNGDEIDKDNYTVVKPTGRKNVGKYTYTFTFKGDYSGTVKDSFIIVPSKVTPKELKVGSTGKKSLTIKMPKAASKYGGAYFQIQYRQKGKTSWHSIKTSKQSYTISKLTKGKKYQVRVRAYKKVNGKTYYGYWSKIKTSGAIK